MAWNKVSKKHLFNKSKSKKASSGKLLQEEEEEHVSLITGHHNTSSTPTPPNPRNRQHIIIPKGFVAVYVGPQYRRFLIPIRLLSMPDFMVVMEKAAEEFGYEQHGGLRIPCDEHDFQILLATCSVT